MESWTVLGDIVIKKEPGDVAMSPQDDKDLAMHARRISADLKHASVDGETGEKADAPASDGDEAVGLSVEGGAGTTVVEATAVGDEHVDVQGPSPTSKETNEASRNIYD